MKLIGLAGKMKCGKSTTAKTVARKYTHTKVTAFGEAVKVECSAALGFPKHLCYTEEGKNTIITCPAWFSRYLGGLREEEGKHRNLWAENQITVRIALQYYATEYRRAEDPDYWTKQTMKDYEEAKKNKLETFIVDDVRFLNEAQCILENDGYLFRIEPHAEWIAGPNANHISEIALDSFMFWSMVFRPDFGQAAIDEMAGSMDLFMRLFPKSLTSIKLPKTELYKGFGCR